MRPCENEGQARIAIIIPTLNERSRIIGLLESLSTLDPRPAVVVADGGSHDETRQLVESSGLATLVTAPSGRGRQLNAGLAAVLAGKERFDAVVFLHADCALPSASYAALREILRHGSLVGGAFRFAVSDSDSRWARVYEAGVDLRSRFLRLPYGDQGFFIRTSALEAVGTFRDWPLFEDVDWYARMRRHGETLVLQEPVPSSARRFVRRGWLRSALRNQALLFLYMCGVPPRFLAKLYSLGRGK